MRKNQFSLNMFFLVLIPWIISTVINRLTLVGDVYGKSSVINIADTVLNIWLYVCIIYWYWVGKKFGTIGKGKKKSFILGNILWGIGLIFYVILFFFTEESNSLKLIKVTPLLSGLAEGYSLGFTKWGRLIASIFTKASNNNIHVLVSYGLMLFIFSIGFYRGKRRKFI
ncbi:MAG TPA: hypothetical protein VK071_04075 [Tissierellales bacterium]|nr:hypothetical protein [Tissierellales bacterium]